MKRPLASIPYRLSTERSMLLLAALLFLFGAFAGSASVVRADETAPAQTKDEAEAGQISRRLGSLIPSPGSEESYVQRSTTFFGIEGSGNRIVYIVDRSASMAVPDGQPLQAAKRELIQSIDGLDELQQCYVMFYNQEVKLLSPTGIAGRLVFANKANKRSLADLIERVRADGATDHSLALRKALALEPDAIFLLTDSDEATDMTEGEVAFITNRNDGRTAIYVVQFGEAYPANQLESLAKHNRGEHKYIDPLKLRTDASPAQASP